LQSARLACARARRYKTRNSLRLTFSEGVQILKNRGPAILEKRIAACTDEREVAKMREHIAKINAHGTPPAASAAQELSCSIASGTRRAAL
jgi:hypothetical protein